MQGGGAMMRTFNASVCHDTGGFFKMRQSLNLAATQKKGETEVVSGDEQVQDIDDSNRNPMNRSKQVNSATRMQENRHAKSQMHIKSLKEMKEGHQGSRMYVRLDKEKQEEKLIAQKVKAIEQKMKASVQKKHVKLRQQSEQLKRKNEDEQFRANAMRQMQDERIEERRKQLEKLDNQRISRIKNEYEEQYENYEWYKYKKDCKYDRIKKQKELNQCEAEKKHEELKLKIEREEANLEYQKDNQKVMSLMKQEMRKLKEQDLADLKQHQKRIKLQRKVMVANKKNIGDNIQQQETVQRETFIKRV